MPPQGSLGSSTGLTVARGRSTQSRWSSAGRQPSSSTGSAYSCHGPPSVRYSIRATPEVASSPLRVTVRAAGSTTADEVGAVASIRTGATAGSETFPAASVARAATSTVPSWSRTTGPVYATQPAPTSTSTVGSRPLSSVADAVTVTGPVYQPFAPDGSAGSRTSVTSGATVSEISGLVGIRRKVIEYGGRS